MSLTTQLSTGIPWDLKHAELMPHAQWRILLAIMEAVVPSVQRQAPGTRKSRSIAYITKEQHDEAVGHLKSNSIVLDSASTDDLDRYLAENSSEQVLFQQVMKGMLHRIPLETRSLLTRIFYLLRCVCLLTLDYTCFRYELKLRLTPENISAHEQAVSSSPATPRPLIASPSKTAPRS